MKKSTAIWIGIGVTVAVAAITAGVIYEVRRIKKLTAEADEDLDELDLVEGPEALLE